MVFPRFIALRFGLRRGEIAALTWRDIDLDGGTLTVRRSAVELGGEVEVGKPKSKKGVRTLPLGLDPGAEARLRAHRKRQTEARIAAGGWSDDDGDLVVRDQQGRRVRPWVLSRRFRQLGTAAGLPDLRLHGSRHTAITTWIEAGVSFKTASTWAGHANVAITLDLYGHLRPEHSVSEAERVSAHLSNTASTTS